MPQCDSPSCCSRRATRLQATQVLRGCRPQVPRCWLGCWRCARRRAAAASLFRSWARLARHFAASRASLRRRVSTQAEEAQLRKLEAALEDELRRVKVEEALLQQQLQRVAPERPQGAPR